MDIRYTIFDPTGNLTLLTDTPVPRPDQPALAAALMARLPEVEQVGFLEPPALPGAKLRLQMMGGEFCGNASMSAAAWLTERKGLPMPASVPLEVSGCAGVLSCRLEAAEGGWLGTVPMPLPEKLETVFVSGAGSVPAVFFSGIVHCILPAGALSHAQAETAIRPLCAALGADACGLLLWDAAGAAFSPLVYVAASDTAVWESGCGSGSAALGVWLTIRAGTGQAVSLCQPGGVITVRTEWRGGTVSALSISGQIRRRGSGLLSL